MLFRQATARAPYVIKRLLLLAVAVLASGCAAGGGSGSTSSLALTTVADAVWQSLATARPASLNGAVKISVGPVEVSGTDHWGLAESTDLPLAFSELIVAGLLRRPDVSFVERRRFTAASDAARRGVLPSTAPTVGVSVAPDYVLGASWSSFGMSTAVLELRLVDPQTGRVAHSWREETPSDADAVGLARVAVGSLLNELAGMDRLAGWSDPLASAAPADFIRSAVGASAVVSYLAGIAAEERWDWDRARQGYQLALDKDPSFFEARVALARTARLRLGGTLAAS